MPILAAQAEEQQLTREALLWQWQKDQIDVQVHIACLFCYNLSGHSKSQWPNLKSGCGQHTLSLVGRTEYTLPQGKVTEYTEGMPD